MKEEKNITRLLEVAKRRINLLNKDDLNEIINSNEEKMKRKTIVLQDNRQGFIKNNKTVRSYGTGNFSNFELGDGPRPHQRFLTKVNGKFHRLELPEKGSFNAGIIRYDKEKLICVYRPDENTFTGCYLDNNYNVFEDSYYNFNIERCADPRLLWTKDDQLLMVYAHVDNLEFEKEYIRGTIIMEDRFGGSFVEDISFRISPSETKGRQKNWMPFCHDDKIYLISSVCPHEVYELVDANTCNKVYSTKWSNPWRIKEHLRGSTNPVRLPDGNYLSTFHTAMKHNNKLYYDNGCYLFSGNPPFNVLKCSIKTYLPAEAACEPPFRKGSDIVCNFTVGMIYENNKVIISYGDSDSAVKIVEYRLEDLLNTMVDVN